MTGVSGAPGGFDWLTARPIAHRGLHGPDQGVVENSLSAARAAVAADYAIECDVQLTKDGEAVVFHDDTLERLTAASGAVVEQKAGALSALLLGSSTDQIPTLADFLSVVAGQVPLICEIKSGFAFDPRLARRVAEIVRSYDGPLALKSFDPRVLIALRNDTPVKRPLGIVAQARYDDPEWAPLPVENRRALAAMTHIAETRPDFLSYFVDDLPHAAGTLFRTVLGKPVVSWTVRTPEQQQRSGAWADQIVFEGFRPA